jgi:hypothetical protein
MRASSPPVAVYKTPLKGMDAREVKPADAPNLLFNVDLSNRGYWKERPGVEVFKEFSSTSIKVMGVYSFRVDEQFYLLYVYANKSSQRMYWGVLDEKGSDIISARNLTTPTIATVPSEPYDDKHPYAFINAGRFVYFCNGHGNFYELETIGNSGSFFLRDVPFEAGVLPGVRSYALGNLKPSSFTYFYDQIVASGFTKTRNVPLSSIALPTTRNLDPPPSLLDSERLTMTVDPGSVCLAEYGMWRSYPLAGDPSGFFWMYTDQIHATAGISTDLLLFGKNRLYKVIGIGTNKPVTIRLSDLSSVGPLAHCYFDRYVLFVTLDGIYITNGETLKKISYEMDPLWFGTDTPQTTRHVQQEIANSAYPFHVNRGAVRNVCCVNDQERRQVMISLPANDSQENNMVWVFNYADMLEGIGNGKWSIWGSAREPNYSGTALDSNPFTHGGRNSPATSPSEASSAITFNLLHWTSLTSDTYNGTQRIYAGTDRGRIVEVGSTRVDVRQRAIYNVNGQATTPRLTVGYPVVASLGRIGRVDSDGRIICTDIAVRRKQLGKNVTDSVTETLAPKLSCVVRSEGEGLKHFDVSETDVEFQDTILNSQQGVSENTKSTLNTLVLGASPTGSNAPLMGSEYFEAYARVNVPDEEGRAAYVDLFSDQSETLVTEPHRLEISEVRVHANIKGGSQREQS